MCHVFGQVSAGSREFVDIDTPNLAGEAKCSNAADNELGSVLTACLDVGILCTAKILIESEIHLEWLQVNKLRKYKPPAFGLYAVYSKGNLLAKGQSICRIYRQATWLAYCCRSVGAANETDNTGSGMVDGCKYESCCRLPSVTSDKLRYPRS